MIKKYFVGTAFLFSLIISNMSGQTGATCATAISVTLPFSLSGITTCGAVNDYSTICGSSTYATGEDLVYSFTAGSTGVTTITCTGGTYTSLFIVQGCPSGASTCISSSTGSTSPRATMVNVVAGTQYYIIIDSWTSPFCNSDLTLSATAIGPPPIPNAQDCLGALPVCNSTYSTTTAYSGVGNYINEINSGISCLGSGERNDVWYQFTVQTSGLLCMTIDPVVNTNDYDWAIFDLTSANCSDIFTNASLQLACDYSGQTAWYSGTSGTTLDVAAVQGNTGMFPAATLNPNNAQANPCISVTAGQDLALNISAFSSTASGFTLTFPPTGTTGMAQIYDNIAPHIGSITGTLGCGTSALTFNFSENILCSTVSAADFTVTGPGGPYTVTGVSGPTCTAGGTSENTFTLTLSPAITTSGIFQLCLGTAAASVTDLCGNAAPAACLPFIVSGTSVTTSSTNVLCNGGTTGTATAVGALGVGPYTYVWNPGSVSGATATGLSAGTYTVTCTSATGCSALATVTITQPAVLNATASSVTGAGCGASNGAATITPTGGTAPYTYLWSPSGGTAATATGLAAGTYTVTVKDAHNCTKLVTVVINTVGTVSSTFFVSPNQCLTGNSFNFVNTGTSTTGTTYLWTFTGPGILPASSTSTNLSGITFTASGAYTVTHLVTLGTCTSSTTSSIFIYPSPTAVVKSSTNATCGGSNGTVTLGAVTGGTSPYLYSFNGGIFSSTTSYTGIAAGTYPITIQDANGCTYNTTITVNSGPTPTAVATTIVSSTCGNSNGSVTIGAVTGGTSPYTYSFNSSLFTSTLTYSGLASGTYTLIVKDASGCTYTTTRTVNNIPGPTAVATSVTPALCAGANGTVTIGAVTGGTSPFTYNFNSLGFSSTTSFSALAAGSYALVVKDANGCTFTTSVTVGSSSGPTVTSMPSSSSVCNGTIIPASVYGGSITGTTFTWTNSNTTIGLAASGSGNTPSFTASNPGTTAITATITVTPIASGCSGPTSSYTITINPTPVITVLPASPTIPLGGNVTLVASGATTYSWSPGTGLSSTTISNPIAGPLVTTLYTVTGTSLGCTSTRTVNVTVSDPCSITTTTITNGLSSVTFPTGTATGNYTIVGTLTVDNTLTFNGSNLIMAPGSKINILTSQVLTITGRTHIHSCSDMWDGIYPASGSRLIISNSSLIEDGVSAVNAPQGATVILTNSIFNRNLAAVTATANTLGTSPVTVTGCVFTSRTIPTYAATASNPSVTDVWTNVTSASPYISVTMRSPNSISKGVWGIKATDVNTLSIGATTAYNGFDNIKVGINLINTTATAVTNTTIYNNKFQYLLDPTFTSCTPGPCYNYFGYGILANGPSGVTGASSITIGGSAANQPNTFNSIYRAMEINDYKTVTILNNSIDNINTETVGSVGYGDVGILVKPAANSSVTINNQSLINNCATGIWLNHDSPVINSTALQIDNNTSITANTSGYCTNGILVTDASTGTTSTIPTVWEINNNIITESSNCIYLQFVKKPTGSPAYNVANNNCTVHYSSVLGTNTNGIAAKACSGIAIVNNYIRYLGGLAYLSTGNIQSYGIYLVNSSNMLVRCNQIDDAGRSMVFEGTCNSPLSLTGTPTVGVSLNIMNRAQEGLVLTSGGIIGSQGSSSSVPPVITNNVWASTFIHQTNCISSTALSSKMYVSNTSANLPTSNFTPGGGGAVAYSFGMSLFTPSGAAIPSCAGSLTAGSSRSAMIEGGGTSINELKNIEERVSALAITDDDASRWQQKNYLYNEIKNNSILTNDQILDSFYTANSTTSFGKLAAVSDAISGGDYRLASSINRGLLPENVLEKNQQIVNDLVLLPLLDPSYVYTSSDSSVLSSIANTCPVSGGNAVIEARNLLMSIANKVIQFTDNCKETSNYLTGIANGSTDKGNGAFKLYPNPNNGTMLLDYTLAANEKGIITIYDVSGKLIVQYQLDNSHNQLIISNDQLNNGVYFYHILVNDRIVKNDKLIIIK